MYFLQEATPASRLKPIHLKPIGYSHLSPNLIYIKKSLFTNQCAKIYAGGHS
jgi:hypothetical protein